MTQQQKQRPRGNGQGVVAKENPLVVIQRHFMKKSVMEKLAKHCGTDVDGVESIVRDMVNVIRQAPEEQRDKLLQCDPASFVNCICTASRLGMRIDARQHCYLVPYGREATIAPGYKGYVNRLRASLEGFDIQTFIWFEEGEFTDTSTDGVASYSYTPAAKNRVRDDYRNAVGCACYITYWIMGEKRSVVEVIGAREIGTIRSKAKTQKVWNEWLGEQMKKAVVRRACKMRFATITDDLDAVDNEHYDLDKEVEHESRADRFKQKFSEYNPFPGEEGIVIDGDATEVKQPEAQKWDHTLLIAGATVEKEFNSEAQAYNHLVEELSRVADVKEREALINENAVFVEALKSIDKGKMYKSLQEMCAVQEVKTNKGEEQ